MDKLNNVNQFSHMIINQFVRQDFVCVDATMGNGYDTLAICKKLGKSGTLFAFDIQESAIVNTKSLLEKHEISCNLSLIKASHSNFKAYIDKNVDFAIYNLGYLPHGDKTITTDGETVIESLRELFEILNKGAIVAIVVYLTHPGAEEEHRKILSFLDSLDQRDYNVFKFQFINQKNNPPVLYGVEFRGGE